MHCWTKFWLSILCLMVLDRRSSCGVRILYKTSISTRISQTLFGSSIASVATDLRSLISVYKISRNSFTLYRVYSTLHNLRSIPFRIFASSVLVGKYLNNNRLIHFAHAKILNQKNPSEKLIQALTHK